MVRHMNGHSLNATSESMSLRSSLSPSPDELFLARVFEEPLVPVGGEPTQTENSALAEALSGYAKRCRPDGVSCLIRFLEAHPRSPWNAALLTNLGLEYYHTGYYSKAMESWSQAWEISRSTVTPKERAIAERSLGELAYMYARLGRVTELSALLESVADRVCSGPATERIAGAREGLWNMRNRSEISFRCGPLALYRIMLRVDPDNPGTDLIHAAESTQQGFSLLQAERLAQKVGLDFQMAHRRPGSEFIVPSVVHLKLDHFAAVVEREGDRYLLQDPTFGNDTWATRNALEEEASGYCLVPSGELPSGWHAVAAAEGGTVWGKGNVGGPDPGPHGPCDPASGGSDQCPQPDPACQGMARSRVHLLLVSLNINDDPVGYTPPAGPAVRFMVRYNQRDAFQPSTFAYSNLGPKWTFDWLSYITDSPSAPSADVKYYIMGGGTRTFTRFDQSTKTFAFQQYDQTKLTRTSPETYEMLSRDGSRKIFAQPDGSTGTTRKVFLTKLIDPAGNAVSLSYDNTLRITQITDAIGQVTTISYEHPTDTFKITKVSDPFGRSAAFDYDSSGRLVKITDVIGITSEFTYDPGDFITNLTTPYGVTSFTKTENGTTRALETLYPDGERDRVEFNQSTGIPDSDPPQSLPAGVTYRNQFLSFRNTFYWDKQAFAFGHGDYTKARLYHWLHTADHTLAAGILESTKEPLEGRVWYDYSGQTNDTVGPIVVGNTSKPAHVGRVLDDGSTQLYTYEYDDLGNVTRTIDPVGRTFSYIYDDNGIDLLEVRQTRAGQDELLAQATYDNRHLLLSSRDAAGQLTTYAYNTRGQLTAVTNALGDTTTHSYDTDGFRTATVNPLQGTTRWTYDTFGRIRTRTDVSGYKLTFEYDDLDRLTRLTHPDSTFEEFVYTLLDRILVGDRLGRQTSFAYNSVRQLTRRTDPLGQVTHLQWCKCGALRTLTDPMGRTTTWRHDIQGRVSSKEYADGSKTLYTYETTTSRLRQRVDPQLQLTQYVYNQDDALREKSYANAAVETPGVRFSYDPDYSRIASMEDGAGTTHYEYVPISPVPSLGAGQLASVDGPMANDAITYSYDALGRRVSTAVDQVTSTRTFDSIGRVETITNALGTFRITYDGSSERRETLSYPNGQMTTYEYGSVSEDMLPRRITHNGSAGLISEFLYTYSVPTGKITSWSQQIGSSEADVFGFDYDPVDRLTSVTITHAAGDVSTARFSYDPAGNRLIETVDATSISFAYNALNELTSSDATGGDQVTYDWDAEQRLAGTQSGGDNVRLTYDGFGRCVGIRKLVGGSETSNRLFLWCDNEICEERTPDGVVSKRFFDQGIQLVSDSTSAIFLYTHDHLGSIREVTDNAELVRARYSYDMFGRQTRLVGDFNADFGFAGMLIASEISLILATFRAYDPEIGRWISRDPLREAESSAGPNLYIYAGNDPVNLVDPSGLFSLLPPGPGRDPISTLFKCMSQVPFGDFRGLFCCMFPVACSPGPESGPGSEGPPYRTPDPPPPLNPANCKGIERFLAKLNCCIYELGIPSTRVCLTPQQQEALEKCLQQ